MEYFLPLYAMYVDIFTGHIPIYLQILGVIDSVSRYIIILSKLVNSKFYDIPPKKCKNHLSTVQDSNLKALKNISEKIYAGDTNNILKVGY